MKSIVLAGGCFWGVEAYFNLLQGVISTDVGYANGHSDSPTYEMVKTGTTGYAEAVTINYDETKLSLSDLLTAYFKVIDPTLINQQGPDKGHQYRTGIYYTSPDDLPIINQAIEEEQKKYLAPIVTEVEPLRNFYEAERYHKDYLKKNPNGYCHIDLTPYQ